MTRYRKLVGLVGFVLVTLTVSRSAPAIEFPILMTSCYTKSTAGAVKQNTDRTNYGDVYFDFTGSGTPEIYCDVEFPNGAGNAWTFTYDFTATTSVASKNICFTPSNSTFIAGDNQNTSSLNAGTIKLCAANATLALVNSCTASAETMKFVGGGSCDSTCAKHLTKLKFVRDNSGSCTNNHTGVAQLRLIHVSTN
jgi:hypothetical protein